MSSTSPNPGGAAGLTPVASVGTPAQPSYSVTVKNYPGDFASEICIPVLEDKTLKLNASVRKDAQIGTKFKFSLEDALNAAVRHLHIKDAKGKNHDNPQDIVEDWLNLLRWEVCTFWMVKLADNWYGETDDPQIYVTSEHPRRAGEMLAEGIAVLFAERRLGVSRAKAFFYEGKGGIAKPDFVFPLGTKPKYGIVLTGRELYGLEVRSRAGIQSIRGADHTKLQAKKNAKGRKKNKPWQPPVISGVLAVYCSYGPPSKKKKKVRCQIILGDPPEDQPVKASDLQMAEVLAVHYIGVTSRIGLWDELELLNGAIQEIHNGRLPQFRQASNAHHVRRTVQRTVGQQRYSGRVFSTLLAAVHSGQITRDEALARLQSGNRGQFIFHGLNCTVIDQINSLDFKQLESFFDPNAQAGIRNTTVGGDGSVIMRFEPDNADVKQVEEELSKGPPGQDAIQIDLDDDDGGANTLRG